MQFLIVGDHDFGDRDRETDLVYQTISMVLHSNAKRYGTDLTVYTLADTYLGDVVETICETLDEPITYEPDFWPQYTEGPITTNLIYGGDVNPVAFLNLLNPEVDYIGCFSDDPANCDDQNFIRQAISQGHIVGFVHSGYGSFPPPQELLPYEVTQLLADGTSIPAEFTTPW